MTRSIIYILCKVEDHDHLKDTRPFLNDSGNDYILELTMYNI